MALTNRGAAFIAGVVLLAGDLPASAASPVTQAFLANVVPNVDFLDRSSRFALKNTKSARLRDFALAMAREQTLAADALYDWTLADAKPGGQPSLAPAAAASLDRTPTGSTGAATARWILPEPPAGKNADERLPRGQEDLDSLEGLEGKAFDAEYKDKQRDALSQVATDYRDYAAKGDDPALKALAARELPKVTRRLLQLKHLVP